MLMGRGGVLHGAEAAQGALQVKEMAKPNQLHLGAFEFTLLCIAPANGEAIAERAENSDEH